MADETQEKTYCLNTSDGGIKDTSKMFDGQGVASWEHIAFILFCLSCLSLYA